VTTADIYVVGCERATIEDTNSLSGVSRMNEKKYDIFISYRHDDMALVKLIYDELKGLGYSIFCDWQLRSGKFPEALADAIKNSIDFLLIVTVNTFAPERITKEDDWVRKEIRLALENQIHIVPVFWRNKFPEDLPDDIYDSCYYNGFDIHDINNLKPDIQEIHLSFLESTPRQANTLLSGSGYAPIQKGEFERLMIQSENSKETDDEALKYALSDFAAGQSLNVLDVGCAYGFVGQSRFADMKYKHVVGIDKNEECIICAKNNFADSKFSYHIIDVCSEDFSDKLADTMKELGIERFDLIFFAFVIHHLAVDSIPAVLRSIRKCMSTNGVILIRSSDDGSKLACNDDGLLEKIIELSKKSRSGADRFSGRKLYGYLLNAGFDQIKIMSFMRSTLDFDVDHRQNLFDESFAYRARTFERYLAKYPDDKEYHKNYNEMKMLLKAFENKFFEKNFWYCEYDYVGIAKK
jgi:2-polyprenyl-3-methyl-5-hydroxy-6-metoxy-1,4-benzoquinol methylase